MISLLSLKPIGTITSSETMDSQPARRLWGEFPSRMDARYALGVCAIIDDSNVYDSFEILIFSFVRLRMTVCW